ncbi:MAG: 3-hydroxyacyl-CoA dehydrogenase family protein [Dethiobacter sp.]|jgi:3-hydroxybutyryl-CoA dehydrogenase|nr:3-hydroxyacyl-CoA dehydrogenase family protein [Dethiobacter sp.]
MKIDGIKKICVAGAGNMGHQISIQAALCGYKVSCVDINEETLAKAKKFAETWVPGRVTKGKLAGDRAEQTLANLSFTMDIKEAAADADFVIEAVTEKLDLKRKLFKMLDEICHPHTILATNSSTLVSSLMADATSRPDKVCNMHFFNPALVMKCVEVVKGPHTSEETAQLTMELSRRIEKIPVLLHKEIYGFLVNRIIGAIAKEAYFLYDMGIASFEDIDSAVVNALGHPMGPFRLNDLTGIDLTYHIGMETYKATGNREDIPSPTIVEKYVKGEWGEKTGKGFYDYTKK